MSNKSPFEFKGNTQNLVNGSITINPNWGIKSFSVLNLSTSSSNGTINGGTGIPGLPSVDTEIIPGGSRGWSAPAGGYLSGMVITSPDAGTTLQIQFLL